MKYRLTLRNQAYSSPSFTVYAETWRFSSPTFIIGENENRNIIWCYPANLVAIEKIEVKDEVNGCWTDLK